MSAPAFLNKPKHKDTVVATSRGWVVEKTGELLVSVKNLDQRIAEHLGLTAFKFEPTFTSQPQTTTLLHTGPPAVAVTLPHIGPDAVSVTLPHIILNDAPAEPGDSASIDALLNGLTDTPLIEEPKDVVDAVIKEVKEIPAEPVVVKKRLGRPPKVRPVEEAPVADTAVMEA